MKTYFADLWQDREPGAATEAASRYIIANPTSPCLWQDVHPHLRR